MKTDPTRNAIDLIDQLYQALRPFAEDGSLYLPDVPDSLVPTIYCEETGIKSPAAYTVGDLRRANRLIGELISPLRDAS